jgi:hypothetical protein
MDFLLARLTLVPELRPAQSWLWQHFEAVRVIPPNLRPVAFDRVIAAAYGVAVEVAVSHMSPFIRAGGEFVRLLGMTSVQLFSTTSSAPLLDLPLIESPATLTHAGGDGHPLGEAAAPMLVPYQASLAAGLPHFSTGFMRNWGRDTFISLRGLLLVTGRFDEVRRARARAPRVRVCASPLLIRAGENSDSGICIAAAARSDPKSDGRRQESAVQRARCHVVVPACRAGLLRDGAGRVEAALGRRAPPVFE